MCNSATCLQALVFVGLKIKDVLSFCLSLFHYFLFFFLSIFFRPSSNLTLAALNINVQNYKF